jgi:hypothetical protein
VATALPLSLVGHTKAAASATGELPGEGATDGSGLGRTPTGVGVAAVGTDEPPPLPPPHALSRTTPAHSQLSRRNDERQRFIGDTSNCIVLKHRNRPCDEDGMFADDSLAVLRFV